MDELFSTSQFDERDLVRIDKEIQSKFDEVQKKGRDIEKMSKDKVSEKP